MMTEQTIQQKSVVSPGSNGGILPASMPPIPVRVPAKTVASAAAESISSVPVKNQNQPDLTKQQSSSTANVLSIDQTTNQQHSLLQSASTQSPHDSVKVPKAFVAQAQQNEVKSSNHVSKKHSDVLLHNNPVNQNNSSSYIVNSGKTEASKKESKVRSSPVQSTSQKAEENRRVSDERDNQQEQRSQRTDVRMEENDKHRHRERRHHQSKRSKSPKYQNKGSSSHRSVHKKSSLKRSGHESSRSRSPADRHEKHRHHRDRKERENRQRSHRHNRDSESPTQVNHQSNEVDGRSSQSAASRRREDRDKKGRSHRRRRTSRHHHRHRGRHNYSQEASSVVSSQNRSQSSASPSNSSNSSVSDRYRSKKSSKHHKESRRSRSRHHGGHSSRRDYQKREERRDRDRRDRGRRDDRDKGRHRDHQSNHPYFQKGISSKAGEPQNEEGDRWDGFQWVQRSRSTFDPMTDHVNKKMEEVTGANQQENQERVAASKTAIIENIPLDLGLTSRDVQSFLLQSLAEKNITDVEIIDCDIEYGQSSVAVELRDKTMIEKLKQLNGVMCLGEPLKVRKINEETTQTNVQASLIALTALSQLTGAAKNELNTKASTLKTITQSSVIKLRNLCDRDAELTPEIYEELKEDLEDELHHINSLKNIHIVRNGEEQLGAEVGSVFVEFNNKQGSESAIKKLNGRVYDGLEIIATYLDEKTYQLLQAKF